LRAVRVPRRSDCIRSIRASTPSRATFRRASRPRSGTLRRRKASEMSCKAKGAKGGQRLSQVMIIGLSQDSHFLKMDPSEEKTSQIIFEQRGYPVPLSCVELFEGKIPVFSAHRGNPFCCIITNRACFWCLEDYQTGSSRTAEQRQSTVPYRTS